MSVRTRRTLVATLLTCAVTVTGLLAGATSAQAADAAAGSFTMTGDEGDYVSGGGTYSYDVAAGDRLIISSYDARRGVSLTVVAKNGDVWALGLIAPLNQQLAVGSYPDAGRPARPGTSTPGPAIDVSGNSRGCYGRTGSFDIADISFGPDEYVERLDATFEQYCEGSDAGLRGHVVIHNPPPSPDLAVTVATAKDGHFSTLNGKATVHGTVQCNENAAVTIIGLVTQVKKKVIIRGPLTATADCVKGAKATWSGVADPTGTTPFQKGKVEVTGTATATDPNYAGVTASSTFTSTVTLTRAPAATEKSLL